jgi:hypothetical protein
MDQIHYLTNSDHLAGQKDISMYNPVIPPQPRETMNKTTASLYPNVTFCGKDGCMPKSACPYPSVLCGKFLTLAVMYNVNATRPDLPGLVIGYSLSGWPLRDTVYIIPAGKTDLSLPVANLALMQTPRVEHEKPVTPVPVTSLPADLNTITPAPANDENLTARIEIDRDIISVNDTISFRVINQGSHDLIFSCGDPYHIERQERNDWIRITGVGGTMAFWSLKPGETSKTFSRNTGQPQWGVLYENVTGIQPYTFSPGRYRIVLEALISVKPPDKDIPVTYTREFVIR